jgi:hypothetical protein
MVSNSKDLHHSTRFAEKNREWKALQSDAANIGSLLDRIAVWNLANLFQGRLELSKIGRTQPWLSLLIVGNAFKVFGFRFWVKRVNHLNSALARQATRYTPRMGKGLSCGLSAPLACSACHFLSVTARGG